jgi:eukaryotic-like serine/threonine-protein kinase
VSSSNNADDTQRALRSLTGLICPRCRVHGPSLSDAEPPSSERGPGRLARCPADGLALIAAASLAEADGDPFLGTTVAGRFVILARLGAGSMGTVYRARQEAMGRDVAIKILRSDRAFDAQSKARFTREARAMSLLTSPHTVTVFDFGEIPAERADELSNGNASLYLAMELLQGESLGQRLKRLRRLRADDAVRFARHVLLSLAEAHEKGVIHRDLKPDNLFLTKASSGVEAEAGEIGKVLDFGIAKVVTDSAANVDALETQAGTVFGTPRYMSPEQAQGKPLDARSDLYSLGVLLYQMLVGRAPFVDDDAVVVMARHIKSIPIPPVDAAPDLGIPAAVSEVVMRALAKDPNDRPASARDFIAHLDEALKRSTSDRAGRDGAAVATGEIAALTRDDLGESAGAGRHRGRASRRGIAALLAAGVAVLVAVLAVGPLRSPEPVPAARTVLAAYLKARAEAGAAVRAAEAARADGDGGRPAPSSHAAPPEAVENAASADAKSAGAASSARPPAARKKPKKGTYKRFDQD